MDTDETSQNPGYQHNPRFNPFTLMGLPGHLLVVGMREWLFA